ncbi:hypothetical protein QC761_302720 [Podospora bellae-mahoneyi]|uniref:Uncharacterized protein n=1 Tax=Podospora bellae-mahoneyi TaxID=2093777 RepID=A0ABR0FMD9_9PEZI|nr:hypothetical protein QC761_302720 [Podospora bellae-mahoneyi]
MDAITELLRARALTDHKARIPIDRLVAEHRTHLVRAISIVLSTELALFTYALFTYAQIIDGLPTGEVAWDVRSPLLQGEHPLATEHEELCPGAMEKAREVCPKWDTEMLRFSLQVLNAYQEAAPGSKLFATRLIEMVAVAIHEFGVADVVGYWAKNRILGGVVVFECRAEECDGHNSNYSNPDPPNIYLSPSRAKVTVRVTQLRDEQQQKLVDFLLLEDASKAAESSPLPILVDKKNLKRFKLESSIGKYGIFRDIEERKPLDREALRYLNRRPGSELDDPWAFGLMVITNIVSGNPLPAGMKRRLEDEEPGLAEVYKKVKLEVESRDDSETQDGKGKEKDDAGKGLDGKEEEGGSRHKVTKVVQSDEKNTKRKIATKRAKKRKSEDGVEIKSVDKFLKSMLGSSEQPDTWDL